MWRPPVTRPPTLLTREITLPRRASGEAVKEYDKASEGDCGSLGLWCVDELVVVCVCVAGGGVGGARRREMFRKRVIKGEE